MTTNLDLARRAVDRSRGFLASAEAALREKRWDDVVFNSQNAAELAAKAVLLSGGIDYPKAHDVGEALEALGRRPGFPPALRRRLPGVVRAVAELAREREPSAYGFERGLDAEFFRKSAPRRLSQARDAVSFAGEFIERVFPRPRASGKPRRPL